ESGMVRGGGGEVLRGPTGPRRRVCACARVTGGPRSTRPARGPGGHPAGAGWRGREGPRAGGAVRPATVCRAGSRADGVETGRRTVRGGAGGPAGLFRGNSVNLLETLRDSARTLRMRALRSHPV